MLSALPRRLASTYEVKTTLTHTTWARVALVWEMKCHLCELLLQVNQGHCPSVGEAEGVCKVEVVANGRSYRASGSVQGGVPVLLELSDSVFRQPISLHGNLLFFKASGSPQLLSSVAGKKVEATASKSTQRR